jgi:predicted enzyme related to lactoylglutathione lyase
MEIDADYNDIVRFQLLVEKLKETLQFYANPDNHRSSGYNPFGGYGASEIDRDAGQRARDILKERL